MSRSLRNIAIVSLATLGSRVLGLVREILFFALLGGGGVASAFLFAFTLPNLFRRLLGEGALTSALVPVFSEDMATGGRDSAFAFLNKVLSRAGLLLGGLAVLGALALLSLRFWPGLPERWYLGGDYGAVLMPYMILVCLAALIGAALNVIGRFGMAALSAVWLNLTMIAALALVWWTTEAGETTVVVWLCVSVLVGGMLQLGLPAWSLWREGWRPRWDLGHTPQISRLHQLFLPGVAGAAILQVNVLVSRLLGMGLNEYAVAALYLSNRLVELPLGLFTIAIATVLFPKLATLMATGNHQGMVNAYSQGMRLIFALTVPAAIGLAVLSEPVLNLLFEWGRFTADDVIKTQPALIIFALGLPFYSLATLATRGFHARQDTRTPVRVAWWAFVINAVLSLLLMKPFGIAGLAMANLISAAYQSIVLQSKLMRRQEGTMAPGWWHALVVIGLAGLLMGLGTLGAWLLLSGWIETPKLASALAVVVLIPLAVTGYAVLLWLFRYEDRHEAVLLLRGLLNR